MKRELLIKNIWDTIIIILKKTIVWVGIGIVDHDEYSKFEQGRCTSIVGPQPSDIIRSAFKELETQSAEII